ncbi:hypothetical protein C1645_832497 [Glomus cerebriforme]|uniref:ATPase domain-containing protein n=1 Tax=Glomus cerebriforme TaxID=658196 RepID=A0A397SI10_9GLOM|nr:hypothetical protein C1645_832497 [Glomus cerebriforme]
MFILNLTKSFKHLFTSSNYISNTNSWIAHYNTNVKETFFNRKQELIKFTNVFSAVPELHVVLGPSDSGKTTLIYEITSKGNFNPLFIDCCITKPFKSPTTIYNSIFMQFKLFFEEQRTLLKNILSETEIKTKIPYFLDLKFKKKENITFNDVSELLNNITCALPNWTFWNNYNIPPPIFIINKVDFLRQLGDNSNEETILFKLFLNWLVINTKQKKHFHAILTCSDSFFLNRIINQLNIPHVTPYIVGDLSKKEAEEYFEEYVLSKYECKELRNKFDHIRKITGTRMFIIERYVEEYMNSKGNFKDNRFSILRSEDDGVLYGLASIGTLNKFSNPLWNKNDFIKVMKALVKSEDQGSILERDLIKEIGYKKVNSLVDFNFLYRRPTNNFAYDIDPPDEVVLTARNQPSLYAMNFSSISENLLVLLLQNNNLQMNEIQMWEHVLTRGLAPNPELSSDLTIFSKYDFKTLKNTLQQLIPFIRLYNLTSKEFLDGVLPYMKILRNYVWTY